MAEQAQPKDPIFTIIDNYVHEAKEAKRRRMDQNRENFDCYHLNADYSHKQKGQSTEFLNKQQMAVEQITSFLQQGLVDETDWFDIEKEDNAQMQTITEDDIKKLLNRQLHKIGMPAFAADSLKMGLLGSLMICKVHGKSYIKSEFQIQQKEQTISNKVKLTREDKNYWGLNLTLVRHEDYFPDPTGKGLYEVEAIDIDHHDLLQLAKDNPDIYDVEMVASLNPSESVETKEQKARETNQNSALSGYRKMIRVYECWGTLLNLDGTVLMSNCVSAVTVDGKVIRRPEPNPNWHNESPYVVSPIIRVPNSVWHRAVMDGPTKHNLAINELYNLMFDGGMMSVFGIKQLAARYLEDPSQVKDGIAPGTTLLTNSTMPPGAKVMERIDTGALGSESFNMFNVVDREFQSSALTNDTRMGNLPQRAVKATEIVASNQTITGIFNGIVKMVETEYMEEVLRKATLTMCQNMNDLNMPDIKDLLGPDKAGLIRALQPEEIFAAVANGAKFTVYGMSTIMNRINDFRKITSLLQTIASAPALAQNFQKEYSFTKLLGEIIKSLEINEDKIKLDDQERQQLAQEQAQQQKLAMMAAQNGKTSKPGQPMSQIGNVGDMSPENGMPNGQGQMQQGSSTGEAQ